MIGPPGTGTALHLDHTSAVNVAFELVVGDQPHGRALAQWLFIAPNFLKEFLQWCSEEFGLDPQFMALPRDKTDKPKQAARPLLTQTQVEIALQKFGGTGQVRVLYQRHGEVLLVQAGWSHQVTNLEDNLKLAFDYLEEVELEKYATNYRELISHVVDGNNAKDYRIWAVEVEDLLIKYAQHLPTTAVIEDMMRKREERESEKAMKIETRKREKEAQKREKEAQKREKKSSLSLHSISSVPLASMTAAQPLHPQFPYPLGQVGQRGSLLGMGWPTPLLVGGPPQVTQPGASCQEDHVGGSGKQGQ
jgi:hypothetical protein